ncbi:MAG: HPr family phosphocarrier protein [Alphaproteobacteria bacterium]
MTALPPGTPLVRDVTIINQRGLHARASARFVKCAEQFGAEIEVSKDQMTVGGTSIMGLMMLAAAQGSVIHVAITGADAEAAMTALVDLINARFGEDS